MLVKGTSYQWDPFWLVVHVWDVYCVDVGEVGTKTCRQIPDQNLTFMHFFPLFAVDADGYCCRSMRPHVSPSLRLSVSVRPSRKTIPL